MVASTRAPIDFHSIQLPLASSVEFHVDDRPALANTDQGVVLSAGSNVDLCTRPLNGMLSFIVNRNVMRDVITAVTGDAALPEIRFADTFDTTNPGTAALLSMLKNFAAELDRPGGILESPAAVASFEYALTTLMLFGLNHNLTEVLSRPSPKAGAVQVKRVEDYLKANASTPISMDLLARETGHSVSSIFRAFRQHRGYTPMQFLRSERMKMARARLLNAAHSDNVSRIAMECGFAHLGRFAIAYRERFGETPSETIARRCMSDN
jgi:AraC-like DNA-binding protein